MATEVHVPLPRVQTLCEEEERGPQSNLAFEAQWKAARAMSCSPVRGLKHVLSRQRMKRIIVAEEIAVRDEMPVPDAARQTKLQGGQVVKHLERLYLSLVVFQQVLLVYSENKSRAFRNPAPTALNGG
jgi:hypothetical protein